MAAMTSAEIDRHEAHEEAMRAASNAAHDHLIETFYSAVVKGVDINLPNYMSGNRVSFYSLSSMLVGGGSSCDALLLRACSLAYQVGTEQEVARVLREFVKAVATGYAEDNCEDVALRQFP